MTTPEGFPDLFVYTLLDHLQSNMSVDPEFAAMTFVSRAIRPNDPTRTIGVIEGEATPSQYEIAHRMEPAILDWTVMVQVFSKSANEVDGRNTRRQLLQRVRKTLFLPSTVQALMTLNDGYDRVSTFKIRRIDFSAAEARDANKQFFFLGQIELSFQTEKI